MSLSALGIKQMINFLPDDTRPYSVWEFLQCVIEHGRASLQNSITGDFIDFVDMTVVEQLYHQAGGE